MISYYHQNQKGDLKMFKRTKTNIFKVMHFEGINEFMQNVPCEVEIKEDIFEIRNNMSKAIATISKNKIQKLDYLLEKDFMQKYHNCNSENNKIPKYYFVITYKNRDNESKYIAFWTTSIDGLKLQKFVYNFISKNTAQNISL